MSTGVVSTFRRLLCRGSVCKPLRGMLDVQPGWCCGRIRPVRGRAVGAGARTCQSPAL